MPTLNQQVLDKRAELKQLNEAIAKRKVYLREQEKLINDTVEAGNTELMTLVHDIALAKKELREIKTDIRTRSQDKVLLLQSIETLQVQVSPMIPVAVVI